MAAKKSGMNGSALSSPMGMSSPDQDDFQARDDAHDVMRYAQLRQNKPRHTRAMGLVRSAAALGMPDEEGGEEAPMPAPVRKPPRVPRAPKARTAGRKMARTAGRA